MAFNLADHLALRKLSLPAAAKKAGIAEERLLEVAAGAEASLGELRKIAAALKVPIAALAQEFPPNQIQMLFRKNVSQRSTKEILVENLLSAELINVQKIVKDLPSNLRWLDVFQDLEVAPENAATFAKKFRKHYFKNQQLEPLLQLPELIANQLNVFLLLIDNQEIEGTSAIIERHAYVLLSRRTFKARMLFTLAHEIGHLVAHRSKEGYEEFALFDKEKAIGTFKRPQQLEEQFADSFASSLLLPEQGVVSLISAVRKQYGLSGALGDIEINFIARFYGVSFEVAGRRCEDMGLLPMGGAHTLYDKLVKDHTNPEKRSTDAGLPAREPVSFDVSASLLSSAIKKVHSGDISIGKVAEALHVPLSLLIAANAEGNA